MQSEKGRGGVVGGLEVDKIGSWAGDAPRLGKLVYLTKKKRKGALGSDAFRLLCTIYIVRETNRQQVEI